MHHVCFIDNLNISFSHNLFILNDIKYVLKLTSIYIYIYKHTQLD